MPSTPTQELAVQRQFAELQTQDLSLENAAINPDELTAIYEIDASWFARRQVIATSTAVNINGVAVTTQDINFTAQQSMPPINRLNGRLYHLVSLRLAGGAVTPITMRISLTIPAGGGNIPLAVRAVTNPGELLFGPVYVPPGWRLGVANLTNGGVGDTYTPVIQGFQFVGGTRPPVLPSPTLNIGA